MANKMIAAAGVLVFGVAVYAAVYFGWSAHADDVPSAAPAAAAAITWLPAGAHLFDGVEVYKGPSHQDVGLIAGGTHGFMVPHSDGSPGITVHPILVVYRSDSSRHWMDTREFAGWFVRSDDPRINSGNLTMLDTDAAARAAAPAQSAASHAASHYSEGTAMQDMVAMEDTFGCKSPDVFNAIGAALRNGNIALGQQRIDAGVAAGDCTTIQHGEHVSGEPSPTDAGYDLVNVANSGDTYITIGALFRSADAPASDFDAQKVVLHMTVTEIACQPLSAIQGIVKAVHDQNRQLAAMMMDYGIGSHRCMKFPTGTPVHIENMTVDGYAEIRRVGDVKTYWTPATFVGR